MSIDPATLRRIAAQLRALTAELEAAADGAEPPRPARPTRAWCLPAVGVVRWDGEVRVSPRRWTLLAGLVDAGVGPHRSVAISDLEDAVGEVTTPGLKSMLSRLGDDLQAVGWPVSYRIRGTHVLGD